MIWEISHAWSVSSPHRGYPFRDQPIFGLPQLETQDMLLGPNRTSSPPRKKADMPLTEAKSFEILGHPDNTSHHVRRTAETAADPKADRFSGSPSGPESHVPNRPLAAEEL